MLCIDTITPHDYAEWLPLWNANNQGQENEAVTKETWARLTNPDHPVCGLVAKQDDKIVGLLHYILHPVTGHVENICYMQDVFVDPKHRKQGVARKIIEDLSVRGKKENWPRIYWLAEADNIAAQELYKNLGLKLDFTLHVMPL